jgi:3-dehydroquinate dehydratase I
MTSASPKIVGVIFSPADLQRALRMRNPPDLFELRLDSLFHDIDTVKKAIAKLPAPFIATARHPREGGANRLSSRQRRALLLEFLPHATYIDVDLRSAPFLREVLRKARAAHVCTIISIHDFNGTPSAARLDKLASAVTSLGPDVAKFATGTETISQMDRLLDFFERHSNKRKIAVMGIGKLGRRSRLLLAKRGCALNYAHLGSAGAAGQLSISELRRALPRPSGGGPKAVRSRSALFSIPA